MNDDFRQPPPNNQDASTDPPVKSSHGFVKLFLLVTICTGTFRLLLDSRFFHTSLLYLALPFSIALVLYLVFPKSAEQSNTAYNLNRLRDATIIMLASSMILFEGFICVLMFMPIYYVSFFLAMIYRYAVARSSKNKNKFNAHIIPLVLLLISSEGVFSLTTHSRYA